MSGHGGRLRRGVRGHPRARDARGVGRDGDDGAASAVREPRADGAAGVHDAGGVDVEAVPPVGVVELGDPADVQHAGDVDQRVQRPQRLLGGVHRLLDGGGVGDVGGHRDRGAAVLAHRRGSRLDGLGVAVEQGDRRARVGEAPADREPDAAGGSRHQGRHDVTTPGSPHRCPTVAGSPLSWATGRSGSGRRWPSTESRISPARTAVVESSVELMPWVCSVRSLQVDAGRERLDGVQPVVAVDQQLAVLGPPAPGARRRRAARSGRSAGSRWRRRRRRR